MKTSKFELAEYLETEQDMQDFLDACATENDPTLIAHALGVIAKAKGMSALAEKTGLGRESLYKSLSDGGNPSFATIVKVVQGLGLNLNIATH